MSVYVNYEQSSVFIRRSCIDFTLDTNEIDCTTSIGGCDAATTTTTTAPTTLTTTTTKQLLLANLFWRRLKGWELLPDPLSIAVLVSILRLITTRSIVNC